MQRHPRDLRSANETGVGAALQLQHEPFSHMSGPLATSNPIGFRV